MTDFYKDESVFFFVNKYLACVGHDFQTGYPTKFIIHPREFDDYPRWEYEAFRLLHFSHIAIASLAKTK